MCKVQLKNARLRPFALFMALFLMNVSWAFAQLTVTGRVQSKSGEPLIGVNVIEKGTTNGTVTDLDGNFSLRTEKGKTLVFSYIGFVAQENVVKGTRMNVTLLEDTETLDEVVVIGYGSMQRKDVTSSITSVKAEDMNVGVITTPAQMLQGKVPGLTIANTSDPNGSASISLRGASSLRTGEAMEPYYVVDGVPGVSISLVAPEDIESIDVLRDASATAIYGSKAANGVIIITTKKGKKDGRTSVSYSGYVAWDRTLKTLDMMTADELLSYAKTNNITQLNDYYNVDNPANTNWQDEVLRTGFSHNHNVSINGGNEKTNYSASLNFQDREGVVRGTNMDRLNARTFVQTKALNNRLELALSLNASIRNSSTGPTDIQGRSVLDAMYYYNPLVPVKNEDGTWYRNLNISQNYNPLSMINEDRYDTKEKLLQGTAQATLHIIDGLDWNLNLSYQNQQYIYNIYNTTQTQLPSVVSKHGQADRSTTENIRKQMETYLNWNHTFADAHKVGIMLGYSWEQADNNDGFGLRVYNFYNDDLTYHNLGMANNMDINDVISNNLSTLRMISFYGRINYSYKSRYLLQATVRRDGSSAFGENNRWATFPSVSAAWRITEEQFMKNQHVFDDLKLRVGYGVSGNSLGFDAFIARPLYGATGWFTYVNPDGSTSNYRMLGATRNANPDLKWESTSMFNIGIDFGFLHNRLSGTIEYYDKRTSDLIYDYPVSTNRYPYGTMTANVGNISNKGIEITINAVPVQTHNFTWSTTLNLSHNKNVVEKLTNASYSVPYIDMADPDVVTGEKVQRIMEGSPIGQFYTYEWAGYNENGVSVFNDYDADGNLIGTTDAPTDEDRRKTGSAQPKLTYGWNNDFTWKNWTLTAFFQGVAGNQIYNATRNYYNNVGLVAAGKNVLSEVATEQNFSDSNAHHPSDRYLESGSYFRLATLTLGYNFGTLGDWVNNLRIYATCNNVFTITGYKGLDPEVYLGGLTPGVDWRQTQYPRTRTFMVGVNVNF
ncbi:tonB-dependent receptor [Phocaeicola plebeius CAG:211]|uniref:TonB-dependent receptor n=1 Tax=Phocaeicola plebeius CAG:211 TaxID=1263052 RepID=R5VIK7_9BACT|nr:TonB-dependent receptor [Phocaeicola plebeius]CCZ87639.1 tonB-dependent receptor [Phocaeicola plebeius CAG:211]